MRYQLLERPSDPRSPERNCTSYDWLITNTDYATACLYARRTSRYAACLIDRCGRLQCRSMVSHYCPSRKSRIRARVGAILELIKIGMRGGPLRKNCSASYPICGCRSDLLYLVRDIEFLDRQARLSQIIAERITFCAKQLCRTSDNQKSVLRRSQRQPYLPRPAWSGEFLTEAEAV